MKNDSDPPKQPVGPPPVIRASSPSPKRNKLGVLALVILFGACALFISSKLLKGPSRPQTPPRAPKTADGISYWNDKIARTPWSIHVAKIDRARKDLQFYASLANGTVLGVSMLSEQARAIPQELGRAVAGVNGDFYERDNRTYAGDPRGLQIVNSEIVSGPNTVCVWFDGEGAPHLDEVRDDFHVVWPDGSKTSFELNQQRRSNMAVLYTSTYGSSTRVRGGRHLILERGDSSSWLPLRPGRNYRARVRAIEESDDTRLAEDVLVLSLDAQLLHRIPAVEAGEVLQISTKTTPDLNGAVTAIAGGPELIKNGEVVARKSRPRGAPNDYSERSKYQRHPRSAVGWNSTHIFLVTVDGRQPGLSVGMKLHELAQYMAGLGCTEAMNLDGGKSAQLWVLGSISNDPCQGQDTVANSLWVIRKPAN